MQKTILISTLVLYCLFVACGQNLNCKEFHNGKFKLVDKENNLEFSIVRDNNIQAETNLKTGEVSKFKVEWVRDCKCD